MKKFISLILILAMASVGASSAFAWVPSDTDDPKCIDIRKLNEKRMIEYPIKEGKKICGCKTCEVAAMTYDQIIDYVDNTLIQKLDISDDAIINFIEKNLAADAITELSETVVLFTDSFREKLCSKFPNVGKKVIGAILIGGAVIGIISTVVGNHYSTKSLMEKNKIRNIDSILKTMKNNIQARNYYFVSTNYGVGDAGALGFFAKKEDINYSTEYGDEYFKKVEEHIDAILKATESDSFFEHKTHEYNKTLNDTVKTIKKVAIGTDLLSKGVSLAKKNGWDLNKIKEWLKSKVKRKT